MQKKLIALAVAGLVSGGAYAQSSVTIYGRANVAFDSFSATGATAGGASDYKSRTRVADGSSRLGFRGEENLGGGLKASFVIESQLNLDGGGTASQSGASQAATATGSHYYGTLASRSSWLALGGNWGEVRAGRQDLYWGNYTLDQTGANYVNTGPGLLSGNAGMVAIPGGRVSNVLEYRTPNMNGLNAYIAYSTEGEAAGIGPTYSISAITGVVTPAAAAYDQNTNANRRSLNVTYANGPFTALLDYTVAQARDTGAATGVSRNDGTKLGIAYTYAPASQVSLIWGKHRNDNVAANAAGFITAGDDLSQSIWQLNWEHVMGKVQLLALYSAAGNVSGISAPDAAATDTKQKGYLVGARYLFSKRTALYFSHQAIINGAGNWGDFNGGGYTAAGLSSAARGADPKITAIGVLHNF